MSRNTSLMVSYLFLMVGGGIGGLISLIIGVIIGSALVLSVGIGLFMAGLILYAFLPNKALDAAITEMENDRY